MKKTNTKSKQKYVNSKVTLDVNETVSKNLDTWPNSRHACSICR